MATQVKETQTVNVYLNTNFGGETVFKLNNPVNDLTLTQVVNAFNSFFIYGGAADNLLLNNSGEELVSVSRAEIVETRVETTPLE